MSQLEEKKQPDDELVGLQMVKDCLLTEVQLSTAMDFQKAVGGSFPDVIRRLGLVDDLRLGEFLGRSGHVAWLSCEDRPPPASHGRTKGQGQSAQDQTVTLERAPKKIPRPVGAKHVSAFVEASIVLDALIRILVRKGIIDRNEIKEEVLGMDPADLVRNGVLRPSD